MNRREVLNGGAAALVAALVPFSRPAEGMVPLEQYERFRMVPDLDGVRLGEPIFNSRWVPVAFEDILEGDIVRRASTPDSNTYRVNCPADDQGRLHVTTVARQFNPPDRIFI